MMMPFPLRPVLTAAVWTLLLSIRTAKSDSLAAAWDDASMLRVQEAHTLFTSPQIPANRQREATFGEAMTLLNLQPKTASNIDRAAMLLQQLREINPNDDIGIASLYYLGRIEQIHRFEPNLPKALELYAQLIDAHPEHRLAQSAMTKTAILKLHLATTPEAKKVALAEVEKFTPLLTDPSARCGFDLVIGGACMLYQLGDETALRYYLDADATGIPIQFTEANVLLSIGSLARKLGRRDMAIAYYERFLKEFPRSTRCFTVREKVAELKAGKP